MANRSRYTETNLLVTQEGKLILLRAEIEVEHDSIIDGTYYWVLRDEIDSGNRMAQKFFDSQPGRSPMQAIRVLHDFLERCLQGYAPLVAADAKLKRLRAALTD